MSILQSFVIYRQLPFYFVAFVKMKFLERTLWRVLDLCHHCRITGCHNLNAQYFTTEEDPTYHPALCKCGDLKIQLTMERSRQH